MTQDQLSAACLDPAHRAPAPARPLQRRKFDLTATRAAFEARSFHGRVQGTVPVVSAHVLVDDAGLPVRLAAELDLTALDSGNRRRDKDLCSAGSSMRPRTR